MTAPKETAATNGRGVVRKSIMQGKSVRAKVALAAAGGVLLVLGLVLGLARGDGLKYFLHAYLTGYCFWLSISLGAAFLVAMLHAARAGWAVTVRRVSEILAANVPLLALLLLPVLVPVLLGVGSLYEWASAENVRHDALLQHKWFYLNPAAFAARCLLYLVVWWWVSRFFLRQSVEQDSSGDPRLTLRMERFSGPALLLLAGTVTFAAFDLLMSLDPHWFSTIYGLYFFSGAMVGGLAAIILAAMGLQAWGLLEREITVEHYHDLGKLLFAFVFFWGYIAFSQYLLIWYGNVPEETGWYLVRQSGPWLGVSLGLVAGHLLIPFLGLLSREAKRRKLLLGFWAAWMLLMHWIDLYWLVMPRLGTERLPLGPIDLCLSAGLGCLWLAGALGVAGANALVPLKDPRLPESLAFENV